MFEFFLLCLIILMLPAVIIVLIMLGTFVAALFQTFTESKKDKDW